MTQAEALAQAYLQRWAAAVERTLDALLPREDEPPETLHRAMRYSTLGGGKRLRGTLAVAGCEAVGADPSRALPLGAALEMLHAYSLIHDDLPAMDDDDLRRGKPTCHRVFGEGMALLAGDALQSEAFFVLARLPALSGVSHATAVAVAEEIAGAVGSRGMAGGQAADLLAEGQAGVEEVQVESIHRRKTGALITAAVVSGALLGIDRGPSGRDDPRTQALSRYGLGLGLAFQVVDDLLDVVGDPVQTGKGSGRDTRRKKATYPAVVGVEASRARVRQLVEEAVSQAERLGGQMGPTLAGLARLLAGRTA